MTINIILILLIIINVLFFSVNVYRINANVPGLLKWFNVVINPVAIIFATYVLSLRLK
jgi:hypothetical protein